MFQHFKTYKGFTEKNKDLKAQKSKEKVFQSRWHLLHCLCNQAAQGLHTIVQDLTIQEVVEIQAKESHHQEGAILRNV